MRRIKLTLEYDGTDFKGFQVQSGGLPGESPLTAARTVQGTVERALSKVVGQPIRIAGASRTDTGVHALGQVASFLLPDEITIPANELCMALNGNLEKDVSAISAEEVGMDFHAQRDSTGKIYSYSIICRRERPALYRRTHWHVRFAMKLETMRRAAETLVGIHDFTSFATKLADIQARRVEEGKAELATVREIRRIEIHAEPLPGQDPGNSRYPGRVVLRVEGSGFLYQMMRTIAGTLVDVARGYRPPEWVAEVLAAKDRRRAGPTAPARGLCLERVLYNDNIKQGDPGERGVS